MVILWVTTILLLQSFAIDAIFFDIDGDDEKPELLEINHEELLQEYLQSLAKSSSKREDITSAGSVEVPGYSDVSVNRRGGSIFLEKGDDAPPLQSLFGKIFPRYSIIESTEIIDGSQILFTEGVVSPEGKVTMKGTQSSVTFNDRIALEDVEYTFEWMDQFNSLGSEKSTFAFDKLAISISATCKVKEEEIEFEAIKSLNEEEFVITKYDTKKPTGNLFNIITFIGDFDSDLDASSFTTQFDGVDEDKMGAINFQNRFNGYGHFQRDGTFQIILESRGIVDNVAAFGSNVGSAMKVILDRDERGSVNAAFVGEFSDTDNPADVVNEVLISENRDSSIAARIRSRKYCILMSKVDFNLAIFDPIKDNFERDFGLCYPTEFEDGKDELAMQAGVALKVEVTLESETDKCLKEACQSNSECSQGFKKTSLTGLLTATGISWTYPETKRIPIKEYLKCLSGENAFFDLPGFLFSSSDTNLMYIYDFFRDGEMFSITLRVQLPEYSLGPLPLIVIKTIDFTYERKRSIERAEDDKKNKRSGGGRSSGSNVEYNEEFEHDVAITIDAIGNVDKKQRNFRCDASLPFEEFECILVVPSFTLGDVLSNIIGTNEYTNKITDESNGVASKILRTGLKNTEVEFNTGDSKKVSVKTQIVIGTYEDIYVEMIYYKEFGFAFGAALKNYNFEALMQTYLSWTGLEVSLPWLTRLEGVFVVSSVDTVALKASQKEEEATEQPGRARSLLSTLSKRQLRQHQKRGKIVPLQSKKRNSTEASTFHNISVQSLNAQKLNVQPVIVEHAYKNKAKLKNDKMKKSQKEQKKGRTEKTTEKVKSEKSIQKKKRKTGKKNSKSFKAAEPTANDGSDDEDDDEEDDDLNFTLPALRDHTIEQGIRFSVTWKTPRSKSDCNDNSICNFLVDYVSDCALTIGGGYFKQNFSMYFRASIACTFQITDELTFEEAALEIGWGEEMSKRYIQISCMLKYVDAPNDLSLRFEGMIRASLSGKLELQFTMRDFVREPLGIRYFAFGDLYLGAKISIEKGKFSATIEFGATVLLGNVQQTNKDLFEKEVLKIEGYFGLNPINIAQSWIYAKINKLTFGKIADMFGQTNFPELFREDGFPDGILFSYATEDQEISALSKSIPSGLHIAGKAKFSWFEAAGDFLLDFPNGKFEIKLDMEPVSWIGGLISLTRKDDKNKGPFFYIKADITKPLDLDIYIDAKAYILGLEYAAKVIINKAQMSFDVEGTLFPGIFIAGVKVETTLGTNFPRAFLAQISIRTTDAARKIKEWLIQTLTGIQTSATKAEADGKKALDDAAKKETDSTTWTSGWKGKVGSWETDLRRKQDELVAQKGDKNEEYETCRSGCTDVCIGFFTWNSHCWKVWGYWVGCPGWDSCYTTVPDLICLAGCELKWLKNAFLEWVQEAINKIGIALAQVAKGLMAVVDAFESAVKWLKEKADELKVFLLGLVAKVIEFVINAINIDIRKLELRAQMKANFDLCFSYAYDLTLFGSEYTAEHANSKFCLSQILKYIINKLLGISNDLKPFKEYDEKKDEIEGKKQAVKEAEKEIDDTKTKTDQEVDAETAKDVVEEMSKRDVLPNAKMFDFVDHVRNKYNKTLSEDDRKVLDTSHEMKRYDIKSDHMVNSYNEHAPWVMSDNELRSKRSFTPIPDMKQEDVKRSLAIDSSMSPCNRVKRSLHNYATITDGLLQSVNQMENGKVSMKAQRRNDINKLADLYVKSRDLGSKYKNYSPKQKRDIFYWYNNIRQGYHSHFKNIKRGLIEHERDTLPKIKSSLDHILANNIDSSFEKYTSELHQHAMEGYKRSKIPHTNDGEALLHGIKKNLTLVVTNEEFPLTHMKRHLNNINQAIRTVNKQVMECHE